MYMYISLYVSITCIVLPSWSLFISDQFKLPKLDVMICTACSEATPTRGHAH